MLGSELKKLIGLDSTQVVYILEADDELWDIKKSHIVATIRDDRDYQVDMIDDDTGITIEAFD